MSDSTFDPKKFIDRESEQGLFEDLLRYETAARILAIRDVGGMGKSHLLEKFQYRCRTVKPRIPISLVALDQLADFSPFSLVRMISEHLSAFGLQFENFARYENARLTGNFSVISSSIYLQASNFAGASEVTIAGTIMKDIATVNLGGSGIRLSPEQENTAREVVVGSFFDDLQKTCSTKPVVIIFDSYDKCDSGLKKWITNHFLEKYFFSATAESKLALIIAGQDLPPFKAKWPEEDCKRVVSSINELRRWKKRHVEKCLRVHGFTYEQPDLDAFYRLIERGSPPSDVIQLMHTYLPKKGTR